MYVIYFVLFPCTFTCSPKKTSTALQIVLHYSLHHIKHLLLPPILLFRNFSFGTG